MQAEVTEVGQVGIGTIIKGVNLVSTYRFSTVFCINLFALILPKLVRVSAYNIANI